MADLLPLRLVRDLLSTLREADEPARTRALIELSDWLSGHRRDPTVPLGAADSTALREVSSAVEDLDGVLASRMDRPAVHGSADAAWRSHRFVSPALDYRPAVPSWKPLGALWTTPAVTSLDGGWSTWAASAGQTSPIRFNLVFERPPAEQIRLVSSLADADAIVARYGSTAAVPHALHAEGVTLVDFSWRCVLEAEISAFRCQRDALAFPCGLGTECSLWLSAPSTPTRIVTRPAADADPPPAGWFEYGRA